MKKYSKHTIYNMLNEAYKLYKIKEHSQAHVIAYIQNLFPDIKPRTVETYIRGAVYEWTYGLHGRMPKYTPEYVLELAKDVSRSYSHF